MCAIFDTTVEIFGDAEFEYQIQRAFSESVEKQSCLPLVKQELQCKIQFDRLSRGEPELVLEQEPAKVYEVNLFKGNYYTEYLESISGDIQ